jgi:hypothetical protein
MDLNTLSINQVNPINVYVNKVAGQEVEAIDADANKLYSLAKTAPSDNQIMRFVGGNGEFITSSAYPISYTITPYTIPIVASNNWEGLTPGYQLFDVGKYVVSGYLPFKFDEGFTPGAPIFRFGGRVNPPTTIVLNEFYVNCQCSWGLNRSSICMQTNALNEASSNTQAVENYLVNGMAFTGYFTVSVAGNMRPEIAIYNPPPSSAVYIFRIPAGAFISYTKIA